jgi:hypothetical protein
MRERQATQGTERERKRGKIQRIWENKRAQNQ